MEFCAPKGLLSAACIIFAMLPEIAAAQSRGSVPPSQGPPNHIFVDASAPVAPPETGYLHLGGTSSTGRSLQVNSRYLVLDGKPWLPVMGEFHFSRYSESEWEDEILKMKAGGVNIVSTYIFWIHHEEVQGEFDWTGRRDLRRFVQFCAKHGMYVWLRVGPWAHGEVRNGGFPDWLAKLPNLRTNDPAYIQYVQRFFNQIGAQTHGLMFKDGGPIIGVQLENEYGLHGPGRGSEHILKLKQLSIAAGIDPPLFSVTGWPSLDFPPQEVLPVSGGYPDGFWYASQTNLPPSMNYLFNFNRELGDMGATAPSEDPTGRVNLIHDPYFAAEEAGGMASAYHRRPVLSADDIAALTLTGIGSGINLYGYYMYHGGANPIGKLSTLQESQASGYPNDLPEISYDFQAPLGQFGQVRESYRKTRLMHLFLNAYGVELAPMAAFAPAPHTLEAANTDTPRVAVRTDGAAGFVFVNNYVRQLPMPARPGFQVHVKLPHAEITVPSKPVDIPADTYFAWPFDLALGKARLKYSTAQLLTRIDTRDGELVVFFAVPGIAPEFCLEKSGIVSISTSKAHITRDRNAIEIHDVQPGLDAITEFTDANGAKTRILVLTEEQAENLAQFHISGADHLTLSASTAFFDGVHLHLRSTRSPTQQAAIFPELHLEAPAAKKVGLWTEYTFVQPRKDPALLMTQTQSATPRANREMGPYVDWRKTAVPTTPPDSAFLKAASWQLHLKNIEWKGLSDVLLQIDYTGDIGRLSSSTSLLDDNFFNGTPWQVSLNHLATEASGMSLRLDVLPLPATPPIYLDPRARNLLRSSSGSPKLIDVKLLPEYESVTSVTP